MTWILLWKITLILALAIFSVMVVLTTIFGARDIKNLLHALRHHEDAEDDPDQLE